MFQSASLAPAYHGELRVFFMLCISFSNPRDFRDPWRIIFQSASFAPAYRGDLRVFLCRAYCSLILVIPAIRGDLCFSLQFWLRRITGIYAYFFMPCISFFNPRDTWRLLYKDSPFKPKSNCVDKWADSAIYASILTNSRHFEKILTEIE